MPINNFSIGRDVAIDVIGPSGAVRLNLITGFEAKQGTTTATVKGLDGLSRHAQFFDGWTGSFDIERQDNSIDQYFAQLESNYFAGLNQTSITIMETITEANGTVSQYRFTGVLLKYDDAGSWRSDATVKQKLSFLASRRIQVA